MGLQWTSTPEHLSATPRRGLLTVRLAAVLQRLGDALREGDPGRAPERLVPHLPEVGWSLMTFQLTTMPRAAAGNRNLSYGSDHGDGGRVPGILGHN